MAELWPLPIPALILTHPVGYIPSTTMTVEQARSDTASVTLPGGAFDLRHLRPADAEALAEYFTGLSFATRMLFAPHPFDGQTAYRLAAESSQGHLRYIAVEKSSPRRICAYFLLIPDVGDGAMGRMPDLPREQSCSVAPSVRDDRQNSGLGSELMRFVLDVARGLGRTRVILSGGVQERNTRAVRFYEKHGFANVGEFETRINNYDMVLEL